MREVPCCFPKSYLELEQNFIYLITILIYLLLSYSRIICPFFYSKQTFKYFFINACISVGFWSIFRATNLKKNISAIYVYFLTSEFLALFKMVNSLIISYRDFKLSIHNVFITLTLRS